MPDGLSALAPLVADFRSDTVTRPSAAMRAAMAAAAVGDDVYREDPTVAALEERIAADTGKEAALFFPSGTQSNLTALMAHCGRGEEILVGRAYHTFVYEAAGASVLGGAALFALPVAADGALEPSDIAAAVKADDPHFPITTLVSLENTVTGRAVPLDRMAAASAAARAHGLAVHLDGARLFNAAAALEVAPAAVAAAADSVSVCFSKGLGAPVGSALCGPTPLIDKARRLRKMLGGGMRQAGVMAAAALHALDHHVDVLREDHARARRLADALSALPGVEVRADPNPTNMIYLRFTAGDGAAMVAELRRRGVAVGRPSPWSRLVLHLDIDDAAAAHALNAFEAVAGDASAAAGSA